ncbi:MAG: hypothetical protein IJW84_03195 [Alphaproteobacteria bacterium]|nr:hypothetical protein [Alphaproteobacteria bacterium]
MIDYNATLQKFFDEVVLFLEKRKSHAKDEVEQKCIIDAMAEVRAVAANPKKYADYDARVKDGLERMDLVDAFMPTPRDNSAYLIYNKVLWNMAKLHSQFDWERGEAQKVLLNALKQMKYKNASNVLKDFYFPFVSPEKYAVKKDSKTR